MPPGLSQASEENLILRLDASTRRVHELEFLVSPTAEENTILSETLPEMVVKIQENVRELVATANLARPRSIMSPEVEITMGNIITRCGQLSTRMRSVSRHQMFLRSEADRRMFPIYAAPHGIKDRATWAEHCRDGMSPERKLKDLQEAVDWWEQEQAKLTLLIESLRSNQDDMVRDSRILRPLQTTSSECVKVGRLPLCWF